MRSKGTLVISLDFEKFWGIHDVSELKNAAKNMVKVSTVVNRLLDLFEKYNIHTTWAVVGLLNIENTEVLNQFKSIPYANTNYSPFPVTKFGLDKINGNVWSAKNDINRIKKSKNQELASHTFSHFYCLEEGITSADFEEDIKRFKVNVGDSVKSIVFPRNQITENCLIVCKQNGLTAFRGNQNNKFWKNSAYKKESLIQKMGRTADAYLKLSKDNLIEWDDLKKKQNGLVNIPSSRFFKPYKFPKFIEQLKVYRIKKQMLNSALTNSIYHLWWHPHNFATNTEQNFKQLEEILIYYTQLAKKYDYQSLTMNEITLQIG